MKYRVRKECMVALVLERNIDDKRLMEFCNAVQIFAVRQVKSIGAVLISLP